MKNLIYPLCGLFLMVAFVSCEKNNDDLYEDYLVARPLTMSLEEFKNSVDIIAPVPVQESGKMYVYNDYIFVNDKYKGVHVIDNSNPENPRKISFIKIAGNVDISVKDNYLYADSITDLMVFDISDINNIQIVKRLDNVLRDTVIWPAEADFFEYGDWNYETDILVGWEVVTERRLIADYETRWGQIDIFFAEANDAGNVGQGGSLARFKIVGDYLYAVDSHNINVFDISDLENPADLDDVYAGFDIETIFLFPWSVSLSQLPSIGASPPSGCAASSWTRPPATARPTAPRSRSTSP